MSIVFYFLAWTLNLYWIHRLAHVVPFLKHYHFDHHKVINLNDVKWNWNNLLLYNDTRKSTIDLWLTEVIPSFIFSAVTGQWWIIIFYYLWASILQERIEHKKTFNIPVLTSGKWHLIHHSHGTYNYGLFIAMWDILFKTNKKIDQGNAVS
jgi:sterol desaturase/sphingolipid hydroxylase (fatty acid hydroxylase superfamily)